MPIVRGSMGWCLSSPSRLPPTKNESIESRCQIRASNVRAAVRLRSSFSTKTLAVHKLPTVGAETNVAAKNFTSGFERVEKKMFSSTRRASHGGIDVLIQVFPRNAAAFPYVYVRTSSALVWRFIKRTGSGDVRPNASRAKRNPERSSLLPPSRI
jgi:hypothetical protein